MIAFLAIAKDKTGSATPLMQTDDTSQTDRRFPGDRQSESAAFTVGAGHPIKASSTRSRSEIGIRDRYPRLQ